MFWKKKEEITITKKVWSEITAIMELMRIQLAEHTAMISLINSKLIKKLSPDKSSLPDPKESHPGESVKYNDGFDEIRGL